ncbi:hypothetical protein C7212DRAFT_157375 [Tuber magnatum]|uniref:Uncharacterized protein n=1 Tax=Tuber magnatum TaxID=42249 RepID=A0A317SZ36_9PEZI|nr:hypothetical protein C7212DRAFT_157375 [Tuber magnatum]
MLLRTHPFSPTTWQLDIPTGSKMPLWHPEVSLVRWDEGAQEIRCSREIVGGGGREVRVHVKGWGCEDDVWVREDDDMWLGKGRGGVS